MKGNKMMNIASVLLILVLLTTCGLSKTYAKYITQSSISDKARVAKWGVEVDVTGTQAFASAYDAGGNGLFDETPVNTAKIIRDDRIVQNYQIDTELLAPGTQGTLCKVSITGQPEVAVQVITKAKIDIEGWDIGKEEYFPIIFTINGDDKYGIGLKPEITNVQKLEEALVAAISNLSDQAVYGPNTNLSTDVDDLEIKWRWNFKHKFVQKPGTEQQVAYYTNAKDTALSDMLRYSLQPNSTFKIPTISFKLDVQVIQID